VSTRAGSLAACVAGCARESGPVLIGLLLQRNDLRYSSFVAIAPSESQPTTVRGAGTAILVFRHHKGQSPCKPGSPSRPRLRAAAKWPKGVARRLGAGKPCAGPVSMPGRAVAG